MCHLANQSRGVSSGVNATTNKYVFDEIDAYIPVRTGDIFVANYSGGTLRIFRFIYAEGENS